MKGGTMLLLSPEIKERLEKDPQFLQQTAVHLVRYLMREDTFNLKPDDLGKQLREPGRIVLNLLVGKGKIDVAFCWAVINLAEREYSAPIEWIIRGEILDEYNLEKRIPLYRTFIEKCLARLREEGKRDEDGNLAINLRVEDGTLSHFGLTSNPGKFRMWFNVWTWDEKLSFSSQRISEDDAAIGGLTSHMLPSSPIALNETTLPAYDRHYDHGYTIADLEELIRWIDEGKLVSENYIKQSWEKGWARDFGLKPKR